MSVYDTTSSSTPKILCPDGTYTYHKVQAFGPSTLTTVTVHDGYLFSYIVGDEWVEEAPTDVLPMIEAQVLAELALYLRLGAATRQPDPEPAPTVGKVAGRALHIALGHLGVQDHYAFTARLLNRRVLSLAALTHAEFQRVHAAIHAQPEVAA